MFGTAREGESFEKPYCRFKRGTDVCGILCEYRREQRFKPAYEERRDKIRAAGRQLRRARGRRSE
jgi:ribosomal protein S21